MRSALSRLLLVATLLLATGLTACSRTESDAGAPGVAEDAATNAMTPEELGTLGAQLDREPDRVLDLLAAKGLSWETYQQAVRNIAADSVQAKRYTEAFRSAAGQRPTPSS